tara:strand:- start:12642 stop:13325 length:684 start_codon:yes stop_codon:yes gene_type:complete
MSAINIFIEKSNSKFNDPECVHNINIFLIGHGGRIMTNFCKGNKNVAYILFNKVRDDKYDNYPDCWGLSKKKKTHTHSDVATDLIIPSIISGNIPDVILCGSRGGQVTLPTLWLHGYTYPSVVINGDIIAHYRLIKQFKYPDNLKIVLLVGKKDYFKNYASILKDAPKQPGVFIVRDPLMEHFPDSTRLYKMLPAMIETARTSSGLPLYHLKKENSELANLEIYNIF